MKTAVSFTLSALSFTGAILASTNVGATIYPAKYPPVDASLEINASVSARTLVASAMMGIKFFGNENVSGMEDALLSTCKSHTPAGSSWPAQCDFGGMVSAITVHYPAQHWTNSIYSATQQSSAINDQLNALKYLQSPSLVPLYGHADHWATIWQMETDATGAVYKVRFMDAGKYSQEDGAGDPYEDGLRSSSGSTWKTTYYQVINSVPSSDLYWGKFVNSYDPPPGFSMAAFEREAAERPHDFVGAPGLVDYSGDMNASVATKGVMEALLLAGEYDDQYLHPILERGIPGTAFEVHGFTPAGDPWNYYLVPIFTGDGDLMSAMVQLSAEDGAFEQVWIPPHPVHFRGIAPATAQALAERELGHDESLWSGMLTWDPSVNNRAYGSTMTPYYEFHVTGQNGESRGQLQVGLHDGVVRGMDIMRAGGLIQKR